MKEGLNLAITECFPDRNSSKPPIIFIHGAWHGKWCWEEYFLSYFKNHGYHAVAFDLRGHGNSQGKEHLQCSRISNYVDDLARVISIIGESPILIGHSMGGLVVQKYLEKSTADAAVLLASIPISGVIRYAIDFFLRHPIAMFRTHLQQDLYQIVKTPEFVRENFFSKDISVSKIQEYFFKIQTESYFASLDMLFLDLPCPRKILKGTPMLVLGAQNDVIVNPKEVRDTALAYKAPVKIFDDMAHDMMLETNWQLVANFILDWLQGTCSFT
ncbi:alpha/beta hydrolase fold protein (plasmid) [Thalassoporum mexicanum PCC 7367]|uniref:alpha/beta hydrolase n=1 Tax=Thalassoporum mexicanum TaxID=3457544 RepID=UPI00029FA6FC|nr:alpha/beta hydrolase [Pseudanabaena sp. PCC 7367]AFY72011.1 alpha/beta hydrolase fold protein [Pseudanabaena sp. PCC 7367]